MRAPWLRAGDGEGELRRSRRGRLLLGRAHRGVVPRALPVLARGPAGGCPGKSSSTATRRGRGSSRPKPKARTRRRAPPRSVTRPEREQGTGRSRLPKSSRPRPGTDPAPLDRDVVTGRLRAVNDGTPGQPPATALDRQKIAHWREAGRYKEETVAAIARARLPRRGARAPGRDQVRSVAWLLELVVAGRVSQPDAAGAVTRASRRYERVEGARELRPSCGRRSTRSASSAGGRPAAGPPTVTAVGA
jgi:hypothetical protein